MTKDDVIRLARGAGLMSHYDEATPFKEGVPITEEVARFAALVAEAERKHLLATDIHSCHDNCQRSACVQARAAVAAEREACALIVENEAAQYAEPVWALGIVNAIRARGQQ